MCVGKLLLITLMLTQLSIQLMAQENPIAKNKPLLEKVLKEWLSKKPACTLNAFTLDSIGNFNYEIDTLGLDAFKDLKENGFKSYLYYSPNKKHLVDFITRYCYIEKLDTNKPSTEKDLVCDDSGNILLWDMDKKLCYKLALTTYHTGNHIAYWLSNNMVVTGNITEDVEHENRTRIIRNVKAYDLKNKKVYHYGYSKKYRK